MRKIKKTPKPQVLIVHAIKDLLSDQLHDEYAEDKEFSSTVKSFLKANGFPVKDVS